MDLLATGPRKAGPSRIDTEAVARRCCIVENTLGLPSSPSNPLLPPDRRRRILLGKGAHAKVWRLESLSNIPVATKEVMLRNASCADAVVREVRLLQAFSALPASIGIVRMHGAWVDHVRGAAEVVLELCPAGSLSGEAFSSGRYFSS